MTTPQLVQLVPADLSPRACEDSAQHRLDRLDICIDPDARRTLQQQHRAFHQAAAERDYR